MKPRRAGDIAAFTLVELAIVLVIIGLLVAGVLVGAEMIKNAEIRSFTSQLSRFNAATTAFRVKYANLPGDLSALRATKYAFTLRSGAAGHGDGNGILESCTASGRDLGCETALFWLDLSQAGLITNGISGATDTYVDGTVAGFTLANYLPRGTVRRGLFYFAYSLNAENTYYLGGIASVNASGVPALSAGLTPREAGDIDEKLDDGNPSAGAIRAVSDLTTPDSGGTGVTGDCLVNTTTPVSYNRAGLFADEVNCRLTLINSI